MNNEFSEESEVELKDERLKRIRAENTARKEDIPNGYISIELSTKGALGAPRIFHVRNFSTGDLLNLALTDDSELPMKVSDMLDNLILEKDVSIKDFHEKEVIETLITIYKVFYTSIMKDVEYQVSKDDWDFLEARLGKDSPEYNQKFMEYQQRRWIPRTNIEMEKIEYYEIDENIKTKVHIKKPDFDAVFSYPKYGDVVLLRDFIEKVYKEDDKRYASILEIVKYRRDVEERIRRGENIDLRRIPNITKDDEKRIKEYELDKAQFMVDAVKGLRLVELNGVDLSKTPLEDRIELGKDARFDFTIYKKVNEYFEKMQIGAKEEIPVYNPVQGKVMLRNYSFRIFDFLQALKDTECDSTVIEFI